MAHNGIGGEIIKKGQLKKGGNMFKRLTVLILATAAAGAFIAFGCGGSSSGDTEGLTGSVSGYTVPDEISAVPTQTDASASLSSALKSLAKAATDADTDYSNTATERFVEEKALEQFSILETVFDAMNQTNYTSEVGNGPYLTKVAWQDEQSQGNVQVDTKKIEEWIVQSDYIDAAGVVVTDVAAAAALRVRAWIIEKGKDGDDQLVKAEFKITSPPTRNADGSYADYGEWTGNVKFGEGGNDYFSASSSIVNGENIITVHEKFVDIGQGASGLPSGVSPSMEMKAIMHRALTTGYGMASFPNYEALFGPDADPNATEIPIETVVYAYDANHVAVKTGDAATQFKDRETFHEMTHRYGVFNKETGENVMKPKSFGFPIKYTDANGTQHAYYGAWQGRHQIWTQTFGNSIAAGTTVTRDDLPPDQPAQTFTVSPAYNGILAKREYVAASLNDVLNIPVEIWVSDDFNLFYGECDAGNAGNEWCQCEDFDFGNGQCAVALVAFDMNRLVVGASDTKKSVYIGGWNQTEMMSQNFVYDPVARKIYVATEVQTDYGPRFEATATEINTDNVAALWANIGGSIYVEYKGAVDGWVEKELTSFDTMNWQPTFNDDGDLSYTLPEGRELYINMQGANYVVTRTGSDYAVQLELQTVANPSNASTFVPANTTFINRWDSQGSASTYEFITDVANANYMKLVYKTIGDNDKDAQGNANAGIAVGGVVTDSMWGLSANIGGTDTFFNWEYASSGGGWGSITYLINSDGTYKYLDDPMRFDPITAVNGAGESKTLSLQFDGWMQGLPDMFQELGKNDWVMTEALSNKIINLAEGTEVTEAATGVAYLIKPLEVGLFLAEIADPGNLSLDGANAIDLAGVPEFVEHGMGDKPICAAAKYSEGNCTADLVDGICTVDSGCVAQ